MQNRLTQTCVATSSPACSAGQPLASYAYTLGAAGNRTGVAESSGRTVRYGYDNDYRLLSETIAADPGGNNGAESYTYDAVGNRKTLNSTIPSLGGGMTYSYDANDRLTTDTYDNDRNTVVSGGTTNIYDFENRMLTHGAVTLVYDGDGNRVSETVGGTNTKSLFDALNPTGLPQILDEITTGSVTRTYVYGLQRISENQLINGTWTPTFYGYDGRVARLFRSEFFHVSGLRVPRPCDFCKGGYRCCRYHRLAMPARACIEPTALTTCTLSPASVINDWSCEGQ
jgi:YD repeat-containing protein